MNYQGIIIEESLSNTEILKKIKIVKTDIEPVTLDHKTPWIHQWTMHTIEVSEDEADDFAEKISTTIDPQHKDSWYVDFKNNAQHFIIFHNKVFKVESHNQQQYEVAKQFGISLGIPSSQLDFY